MIDVVVIGGGVSGLAAADELKSLGHRVLVLERQARPGGNAISERLDGFLMEHGPSTANGASPVALAASRSLGLDPERCSLGPGVRYRYLVGGSALRQISVHPLGFLVSGYLSLPGRLRLLAEVLAPAKRTDDDETVAAFGRRRFGREFTEKVIDPLMAGLFAGRAAELSAKACLPALVAMERDFGSVVRALVARRLAGGRMPARLLFSWRDGIGSLPRAFAGRLDGAVRTGVAVRRIGRAAGGFRIEAGARGAIEARAVLVATQPHAAAQLLEGLDQEAAEAAAVIEAPPLAVVFLGYRRGQVDHPLDGLGYLAPTSEKRPLNGAQFCSTMFPGRAPEGHVAVAGYLGGARAPDVARLPPSELIALAKAEFRDLIGARGEPVLARARQWPLGLPQYRLGHAGRAATLTAVEERRPGLFLTGNYLTGPSVAACLAQAKAASARIDRFLVDRRRERAARHSDFGASALRSLLRRA